MELSTEFEDRLNRFAVLLPDWDGEKGAPIAVAVLNRAHELALRSLDVAPEPFVAPCGTGELLLLWHLPNGATVDYFVGPEDEWDDVPLTFQGDVYQMDVTNEDGLMALLVNPTPRQPSQL